MTRPMPDRTPSAGSGWGRRKLLAAVAAAATLLVVLVAGLGYAIYLVVADHSTPAAPAPAAGSAAVRDRIAAEPMLTVDSSASRPSALSAIPADRVAIPAATRSGPAGVPTGFPHTPEGAVGQLAAIEVAVLASMSIDYTAAVHQAWTWPGAPGGVGVADGRERALVPRLRRHDRRTRPGRHRPGPDRGRAG